MKGNQGFTLIEIIAAMTIITIGLVSLLALFPTGIGLNQQSANNTQGTLLCKSMIEEIKKAATSNKAPGGDPVLWEDLTAGSDPESDEWYQFGAYAGRNPAADGARWSFPENSSYEIEVIIEKDNDTSSWNPIGLALAKVVVKAYWPLARGDADTEAEQGSVTVVSYIVCKVIPD